MRLLRLGRMFDGVLIHDAIMYMTSEEDLRAALVTAYEHCKPGGVVVIAPEWVAETFRPRTARDGVDAGGQGVRYLEWIWDADPNETKVNYEVILAFKENDEIRTVVDRQVVGLFPRATWLRLLEDVGFKAEAVEDPSTYGERSVVFLGHKQILSYRLSWVFAVVRLGWCQLASTSPLSQRTCIRRAIMVEDYGLFVWVACSFSFSWAAAFALGFSSSSSRRKASGSFFSSASSLEVNPPLNSLMPLPKLLPSSGRRLAPKTTKTITRSNRR